MSSGRRVTRPIRQLSLQQPTSRRLQIRRQRSTEDDYGKSLQIYANSVPRRKSATNVTETKKHVRVAWGKNDSKDSGRELAQVEVIAHQIPGRLKSATNRPSRSYVATESILYSRQELAERLRLAWKHREENKANIDIFLAHGMKERSNSELSISVPTTASSTKKSDYVQDDVSRGMEIPNFEVQKKELCKVDNKNKRECEEIINIAPQMMEESTDVISDIENEGGRQNEKAKDSRIDLDLEKKKKTCITLDCLHPSAIFSSLKSEDTNSAKLNDNFSMAKQKRASFHSKTNRAFLVPMMEKPSKEIAEAKDKIIPVKSVEIRCASAKTTINSPVDKCATLTKNSSITSLRKMRRTNSAPSQRENITARMQVNIVIDASGLTEATDKSINCRKMQNKKDIMDEDKEDLTKISQIERSIKSAPVKRKSKSAKRRFFTSLSPSRCKDEQNTERRKNSVDPRTSDVITMVSLISSADSDSDMENSSSDDKLIDELRNKLPTTPIIKTSINTSLNTARKPIKSVSFQRSSFEISTKEEKDVVNDVEPPTPLNSIINVTQKKEGNENLVKQDLVVNSTVVTSTLAAVSALITQDAENAMLEAPLNNREKRCLAVPIGELHDKKWKLLQAKSAPSYITVTEKMNNSPMEEVKEQKQHFTMSSINLVTNSSPPINSPTKVGQFSKETLAAEETSQEMSEPHLQTTKEKECWHLYRRMCDKGVCVSFNTVLRGMLTPTEYRMRQKEFSLDLQDS
ncbi:uncharacterized protein LOC105281347 isoform X1 [Ooceraea biroi]|nr:uncharacterized protein LOC105281347 isoform X1 [Ooceraea biroi]XP_026824006.1 uncharacterized protein LOC105281347 isoform X1 [Ooceraea biroi]